MDILNNNTEMSIITFYDKNKPENISLKADCNTQKAFVDMDNGIKLWGGEFNKSIQYMGKYNNTNKIG